MAANRVGWLGLAAAVLAVAGLLAVVTHDDDDGRTAAAVGDPSVTTSSLPELPTSTTEPPPAVTTTLAPGPPATSTPTTTAGRTTTTRAPRTTAAPSTTAPPRTATPTTAARPQCANGQIDLSASIDNTRATAGQPVTFTTTIRNQSQSTCYYQGYDYQTVFRAPNGATLVGSNVHADALAPRPFAPGQSLTHSATWDPRTQCGQPSCPPPESGIYSVTAVWLFSGGRYQAFQQFVIP